MVDAQTLSQLNEWLRSVLRTSRVPDFELDAQITIPALTELMRRHRAASAELDVLVKDYTDKAAEYRGEGFCAG